MTETLKIEAGQFVTAPGFSRAFRVSTARSYAAKYKEDAEVAHARARRQDFDTAWTVNGGSVLTDNRAENLRRVNEERATKITAIMVTKGQVVEIEGEKFVVQINGERYADPISFRFVTDLAAATTCKFANA